MSSASTAPLSAPEAMVLIEGPRADPHEIVFLALLELVVRGGARLAGGPEDKLSDRRLMPREHGRVGARPLVALVDVIDEGMARSPQRSIAFAPTRLVREAFAVRWGTAEAFVRMEVWGGLEARGFVSTRERDLDVFAVYPWHRTAEGDLECARLHAILERSPDWQSAPGTTLLELSGLAVPSDDVFDAIDELEDGITPPDIWGDDGDGSSPPPSTSD
ncbi:MAG: hypothetical protein E6I57_01055 [Chloroflexi bacterium]|nr:MAG: hypothetical protein E6J49_06690 [Chloroflexota bacterium]TMB76430.1 MAG: hypothetical protein E6J52_07735 [Chloroflexota bacterium]TMC30417.1 MAG: hypothetical protein E6J27_03200 [Chloroflexota bacterium]TMC32321.1 MAG: hypothetical protein E6J24_13940 [Chloroflexota bacterium]TMC59206.1 MAG: hypothetical protein E6J19_00400 [Chloroflexota bacterium]